MVNFRFILLVVIFLPSCLIKPHWKVVKSLSFDKTKCIYLAIHYATNGYNDRKRIYVLGSKFKPIKDETTSDYIALAFSEDMNSIFVNWNENMVKIRDCKILSDLSSIDDLSVLENFTASENKEWETNRNLWEKYYFEDVFNNYPSIKP